MVLDCPKCEFRDSCTTVRIHPDCHKCQQNFGNYPDCPDDPKDCLVAWDGTPHMNHDIDWGLYFTEENICQNKSKIEEIRKALDDLGILHYYI